MNTDVIIDWAAFMPLIIVLGAAVIATLMEAFAPRGARRSLQISWAFVTLVVGLGALIYRAIDFADSGFALNPRPVFGYDAVQAGGPAGELVTLGLVEDGTSLIASLIIVIVGILSVAVVADRSRVKDGAFVASAATRPGSPEERESTQAKREQTEIFPLMLFAIGGMMAFSYAYDLLTLFIALELLSLPLYVMSAMARRRRLLSQEAAMKYFLLGAFSSAVFLMGAAFIYGGTGTLIFRSILNMAGNIPGSFADQTGLAAPGLNSLTVVGVVMLLIGLLFKVGAAPFHQWVPDVYQGAPTPITGFMAAGTKVAAFAAITRVMLWIASPAYNAVQPVLWVIIIATIVVGSFLGVVQNDIKRMLAYSSIAHAGFILIAVHALRVNADVTTTALESILFYLLAYSFATIGAFAVITLVREKDSAGNVLGEATKLSSWRGLGKRKPSLALAMAVFFFSFAGIPLTGGFIGKFEAFRSGMGGAAVALVVLAVAASAVTAFFYFRLIALMFFEEPDADSTVVVASEGFTTPVVWIALIATLLLGVLPSLVLDFIASVF